MGINGFQGMVITQQGLNLLEKAQTGTQLKFTRVAVGDGNLSGQDPTLFTQLIDQIMSLNISEINIGGSSNATISTVLSNEGLNTGFYWREIGIFAQDPDLGEILYCYNNLAGHEIFVPAINTKQFKASLEIEVFISNAVNVTALIDPSLTYVPLTGATMVGLLILSGDPDQALGAATKQYVDNHLPPNATTTQPGIVEVSAAPTGIPVAVSTTDPAYTAVNGGTYVTPGEGLTSTSQTNGQTLGVVFSTSTPAAETEGNAGAAGTSTEAARADHVHPMPASYKPSAHESTHVTGGSDAIPVATETTDGLFSSTDKTKLDSITSGATNTPLSNAIPFTETEGAAGTSGVSNEAARADHIHPMPTSYMPSAHEATHVTGGSDAIPVATETTDGLFSSADKSKLDGITSGATNTPLSNETPSSESAGTVGTAGNSIEAARADHVHSMPATYAPSAHASSHAYGGADPITPVSIGAETPEGAQAKADSIQSNLNEHLADNTYQTAGGTATAITLTIGETFLDGLPVNFKCALSNSGAATTINGKPFYKPGGTTAPNLIAGKYYTAIYNVAGLCFFIKASAEGNTVAGHVLAGDTFSNDSDTGLTGTMPNNSTADIAASSVDGTYTVGRLYVKPQAGYYVPSRSITVDDPNYIAQNILSGKSIFGLAGTAIPIANYPHSSQAYTIPGTYTFTVPANVTEVFAIVGGGGGGGGGSHTAGGYKAGGGGAGGVWMGMVAVTPGSNISIVVGSAGTGGIAGNGTGVAGGNSSFGATVGGGGAGGYGWDSGAGGGAGGSGGGYGKYGNAGTQGVGNGNGGLGGAGFNSGGGGSGGDGSTGYTGYAGQVTILW